MPRAPLGMRRPFATEFEMTLTNPPSTATAAARPARESLGRVIAVSGSEVTIGLSSAPSGMRPTVGKFLGVISGPSVIVGMITEISERPQHDQDGSCRSVAKIDLVGEIRANAAGVPFFQRGISEYPMIGEPAMMMGDRELRLIYNGGAHLTTADVGVLQQDQSIPAHIDIDQLVSKHFAVLGTTGVGKSNAVAILIQYILKERPDLRIFLIDPHNEYARCFGDKAQVLTPRNLRLPFWLFNFEETVDAFFGGRPGISEEVEILAEAIPQAKGLYLQLKNQSGPLVKKKDARTTGYGVDTPVPYRIEDLVGVIDERMGKLENRSSRVIYHKLMQRIQTFRNHPRYGFMFENATVGGDTMADVLGHLFRIPANGTPMTIMQLAGFPAEVVDSVVSVLSRMAFDFGLWSDGASPLLFACEEAHRYAPSDSKIGFGPTRRALSRIAKEGRKYGVFLGLVTQRPAEIDPTIISQCNTLFVMRLSNDRDQSLIRSAVSDAGSSLLTFVPSLGTGEVFAFGAGVPLPTRMKFREVPLAQRPTSEAGGATRPQAGASGDRDMIGSVVERWRASTMSHRGDFGDDAELGSWREDVASREDAPPLQPAPHAPPLMPASDVQRPSILRRPLSPGPAPANPAPANPAPLPNRYR
jgi:DNA helicase HerA-like ATPase